MSGSLWAWLLGRAEGVDTSTGCKCCSGMAVVHTAAKRMRKLNAGQGGCTAVEGVKIFMLKGVRGVRVNTVMWHGLRSMLLPMRENGRLGERCRRRVILFRGSKLRI